MSYSARWTKYISARTQTVFASRSKPYPAIVGAAGSAGV